MMRQVLFVCVRNRVRSVYAEFYLMKLLQENAPREAPKIVTASAGFYPGVLKDMLEKALIEPPDPFFGVDMSPVVREMMAARGFGTAGEWRSREIKRDDVSRADLIVTALSWQKEEIADLYPAARKKIFTFREMAEWRDDILFETVAGLPMDDTFWDRCEEDPPYVRKVIQEVEELMNLGFRNMLRRLGMDGAAG